MKRLRLVFPVLLLVSACGDDGESSESAAPASPSTSASTSSFDDAGFRREAERICTDFLNVVDEEPSSDPNDVARYMEDAATAHKDAFARLSALEYPPTEEGRAVRAVLVDGVGELQRDFVTAVAEAAQAVQRRDRPAFDAALAKITSLQPPDNKGVLRDNRLPTCSQAFSTG